jgi:hypothetical protein
MALLRCQRISRRGGVQRLEQILTDLNWARYIESRTTLGNELILPQ